MWFETGCYALGRTLNSLALCRDGHAPSLNLLRLVPHPASVRDGYAQKRASEHEGPEARLRTCFDVIFPVLPDFLQQSSRRARLRRLSPRSRRNPAPSSSTSPACAPATARGLIGRGRALTAAIEPNTTPHTHTCSQRPTWTQWKPNESPPGYQPAPQQVPYMDLRGFHTVGIPALGC